METILNECQSTYGSPYAFYTVSVECSNRTATTTYINVRVVSHLQYSGSSFGTGYTLNAGISFDGGNSWNNFNIKSSSQIWSGTTNHTTTQGFTISTSASITSLTNVQFRVLRGESGNSCRLNATACSNITLPLQPITPTISFSGNIQDTYTVTIYPNYSGFSHVARLYFGNDYDDISFSAYQSSVSYTVPSKFYSQIPNGSYGTGSITVYTYDNGNLIGSSSGGSLTLYALEARCKPALSNITLVDTNSTTTSLTGNTSIIIPRYSTGRATATLTAYNSATASAMTVSTPSRVYSYTGSQTTLSQTINLGTLSSGRLVVNGRDSRGFNATEQTLNLTTVDYTDLLANFTFYRNSPTGNKMYYKMTGSWWSGNFGAVTNNLTLKWRLAGTSTWNDVIYSVVGSGTTKTLYSGSNVSSEIPVEITHPSTTTWNYTQSYQFELLVQDRLNSYMITKKVTKGKPIFNWGNNGSKNIFNVNGELRQNDAPILDLIYPIGSIYMSVNSTNPASLFGGTWSAIGQGRCLIGVGSPSDNSTNYFGTLNADSGMNFYSEEKGGQYYHTLSIYEMPTHNHDPYVSSATYSGADFYIRHGSSSGVDSVASGNNTSVSEGQYWDTWGNGFSVYSYSHKPDKISIGGSVSVNVAEYYRGSSYQHNNMPPYYAVYIWKRVS